MTLHGKNRIGQELSALGHKTFVSLNPATGENLPGIFYEATIAEIELACGKAAHAFQIFRLVSGVKRAEFLEAIAVSILAREQLLKERVMAETAYPEGRALQERDRTVNQIKMFAALLREGSWVQARIDTALPDRKPIPKPDIRQFQIGIGPIVVFGASNFPQAFSTAGGDTASALAAGCPVIVKGHPAHPGISEIYAEAIIEAAQRTGMPDGVFSLLQGVSHTLGASLVQNPHIKAVGFTGSFNGGMALVKLANARTMPIPVYAEMSSVNPVFVLPEVLQNTGETIAENFVASLTLGAGQFCTSPGLVIVLRSQAAEKFAQAITMRIEKANSGTFVHPSIHNGYATTLKLKSGTPGVQVLARGQANNANEQTTANPAFLSVAGAEFLKNPTLGEEIFGPAAMLVLCENEGEFKAVANSLHGQLTATVHGTSSELESNQGLFSILEQKVGRILVNGFPTGVEVCHAMHHGGPFPSTSNAQYSSVGTTSVYRFTRPVCFQNVPDNLLPSELKEENPLGILRFVNGESRR